MADSTAGKVETRIGGRLRHARLMKGMNLKEVAAGVGCSESFVSKLENDKVNPSLAVLHRLVALLDINIAAIFSNEPVEDGPLVVMQAGTRPSITTSLRENADGVVLERLIPQSRTSLLQVNIHQVEPGGSSHGLISHVGEEMGYVLEGELELTVGAQARRLRAGDSFFFPSEEPHGYVNVGKKTARVLWVNTPPTF